MRFKRVAKHGLYSILSLIGFVLLYLLTAFLLSRWEVKREIVLKNVVPMQIFILTNGVHTDIVVPVKNEHCDWSAVIPFSNTTSKDSTAKWLAFGWGDKGFYLETPTWADLKFSTAIKSIFGLSSAAIHTTYYHQMQPSQMCKAILILPSQYHLLERFIKSSLKYDKQGRTLFIQTNLNYCKMDAFYEANGSYSLINTCNTWANDALKMAGLKACMWTPFDKGIFYHYK